MRSFTDYEQDIKRLISYYEINRFYGKGVLESWEAARTYTPEEKRFLIVLLQSELSQALVGLKPGTSPSQRANAIWDLEEDLAVNTETREVNREIIKQLEKFAAFERGAQRSGFIDETGKWIADKGLLGATVVLLEDEGIISTKEKSKSREWVCERYGVSDIREQVKTKKRAKYDGITKEMRLWLIHRENR